MYYPTLQEAKDAAASGLYRKVPVSREIFSDFTTPIEVLRTLKQISNHCYLLESAEDRTHWGRYTFLGFDPVLGLTAKDGIVTITKGGTTVQKVEHPGNVLRQILSDYHSPRFAGLPTFTGGLVGYFAYDYVKYAEPSLRLEAMDREGFQDMDLMLFDQVIAFDHFRQRLIFIVNADVDDLASAYPAACAAIDRLIQLVKNGKPSVQKTGHMYSPIRALFDEETYCKMVEKAKVHIQEGDIFQVVLSNRFEADYEGSLLNAYRVLRATNPSPYMFYFSGDDVEIAGASPETLVKLEDGVLHTFPLAGTRPRGENREEDEALEAELLTDEKECAEHNMLVDLGRNDLGKISIFGSVVVEKYMEIEKFSHVMHIGSTVAGKLRPDKDAVDAVDAILPAGTLSGAPKHKAMEIIDRLENEKRGVYGGAIGYLDFTGNMDTCIAIRIAYKKNGKVFVRSGAGIVADSVPEMEYQECLNKARAVIAALELAQKGEDL